jgi:hypothetical protein
VVVRLESGDLLDRPPGWTEDGLCIACQRKAADKESGSEGVLRFELQRGTPLMKAAKRAHMTTAASRAIRQHMVRRGEVDPQRKEASRNGSTPHKPRKKKEGNGTWSPHRDEIERVLRADHTRQDLDVAKEFGVTERTVRRARGRLGLPDEPTHLERDAELLRQLGPSATAEAFAARIGVQLAGARRRLRHLRDAGLAEVEVLQDGQGRRKLYTARTPPTPSGDHPAEG